MNGLLFILLCECFNLPLESFDQVFHFELVYLAGGFVGRLLGLSILDCKEFLKVGDFLVLIDYCLFVLLAFRFQSVDHFVAQLHLLQIKGWSGTFIVLTLIYICLPSVLPYFLVSEFSVFILWRSTDLGVRAALNVVNFCRTWNLLQDKWISFTAWGVERLRLKLLTFWNKFAFTTRLISAGTSTGHFERKWFLSSRLVILFAANWLHLGRRHNTVHQFCKLVHIILARNISTDDLRKSFALNPHNCKHLKVRAFLYIHKPLQIAEKIRMRSTYTMRLLYRSGFSLQHIVRTIDSTCWRKSWTPQSASRIASLSQNWTKIAAWDCEMLVLPVHLTCFSSESSCAKFFWELSRMWWVLVLADQCGESTLKDTSSASALDLFWIMFWSDAVSSSSSSVIDERLWRDCGYWSVWRSN